MKIHSKSSELTQDEKLIRVLRNIISDFSYDDFEEMVPDINDEYHERFDELITNYKKLNEDKSKK